MVDFETDDVVRRDMTEQSARWLMWGEGERSAVVDYTLGNMMSGIAGAIDALEPVRVDDGSAAASHADTQPITPGPDRGETDAVDEFDHAELVALIHERDPDWIPTGELAGPGPTMSWMEVVPNATEREVEERAAAHGALVRGFLRLPGG
jgi:hypothetical protein